MHIYIYIYIHIYTYKCAYIYILHDLLVTRNIEPNSLDGDFPSATFDESAIRCHFPELWTPGLANLTQLLDAPAVTEGPLKRSMFGFWKQRDFIHPVIRLPISPIFQCIIMPVVCLLHAPRPRLRGKNTPEFKTQHNTECTQQPISCIQRCP